MIHACLSELGEHFCGIATINGQCAFQLTVIGKGVQGLFGDGVNGIRSRQRFDVKRV